MASYLVRGRDFNDTNRTVSAASERDAAKIYLSGAEVSPHPPNPQEADRPACYVLEVPAAGRQMAVSSTLFWRAK
jgi:hypothetical protein